MKTWFQNRRMKEKRQQREDEQSRAFCLPTGGVDVSQLAALGIRPPPYPLAPSTPNMTNGNMKNSRLSPVDQTVSRDDASPYGRLPSPIGYGIHGNSAFYPRTPSTASPVSAQFMDRLPESIRNVQGAGNSGHHVPRNFAFGGAQPQGLPANFSLAAPRPVYPSAHYIGHHV